MGYTATNQVEVKVRKLSDLGNLLDRAISSGANRIQQVSMSVADPSRFLDEARRKALAEARHKAEFYAQAAGAKVGRPLLIEEPGTSPRPVTFRARQFDAAKAASAVPIAGGEQTLNAQVTVTYSLNTETH